MNARFHCFLLTGHCPFTNQGALKFGKAPKYIEHQFSGRSHSIDWLCQAPKFCAGCFNLFQDLEQVFKASCKPIKFVNNYTIMKGQGFKKFSKLRTSADR